MALGSSGRSTAWPPADAPSADDAAVLDAVGTREDEGQRQVLDRLGGAVAGKGGDMHILAGAVDAALGPGIDVERAGRRAAGDAAVGQVEAGAGHVEEDEVVVALLGHQHGRHHAAFAARQAGIEDGAAFGVGLRGAEDLVVPGKQRQFGAGDRLGGAQRAGKDIEPVLAGIGRQADVGDDEPLRGARIRNLSLVVVDRLARSAHRRRACAAAAPRRPGSEVVTSLLRSLAMSSWPCQTGAPIWSEMLEMS